MTTIEQAGAISFRIVDEAPRFLLVTAKRELRQWIFPKGHIETGESAAQAAARELREEGGVEGKLLGYVGELEFDLPGVHIRVRHYLFEAMREVEMSENRGRRWCSLEEALATLSFPSTRAHLADALKMIAVKEGNAL